MKKFFYVIFAILAFVPFLISNAAINTITTCENPVYDENNRQTKICYLDIQVSGNTKFQTLKGKFTLTNTTFKVAPQAGDSRIKLTDNGNNTYTFSATSPISNQTIRLAKFTMYLSENGKECKVIWTPTEYLNSYCEVKDGNFYDLNGNVVSEDEYKKQCEKHYCEVVDGTYFGRNGESVTASEYKKQCEKHYCEVVDGTYYDKNGNSVSKVEYTKSCSSPTCKVIDGVYYDKNSKVVSATEYDKQCNVHYCKIIDNTYFGKNGNIIDKATWDSECTTTVPDTGGFFSIGTAIFGAITLAGIAIISRKINVVKKI